MSDLNDKELFDNAIADTPAEAATVTETPATGPEAVQTETAASIARDDKGRFAPKEQAAPAEAVQPTDTTSAQQDTAAHVPSWRLREVNEAREAAERRAQETEARARDFERQLEDMRRQFMAQQPKAEPVDFFADPDAALKNRLDPFEQRVQAIERNANLRASRAENIAIHGRDTVTEMEKAVEQAMRSGHPELPALRMQMLQSEDPVGVAMQWYQRDKLLKETGGDLSSYKSKMLDDALKDPAFLAKALEAAKQQASGQVPGSKPNNVVQIPPSISRATAAASPHEENGDLSDRSLYSFATR